MEQNKSTVEQNKEAVELLFALMGDKTLTAEEKLEKMRAVTPVKICRPKKDKK